MIRSLIKCAVVALALGAASVAQAGMSLTGVNLVGYYNNNGQPGSWGTYLYDTNPGWAANMYLTTSLAGSFINTGNTAGTVAINLDLDLGSHTYYFFTQANGSAWTGMNLFFNGHSNPDVSGASLQYTGAQLIPYNQVTFSSSSSPALVPGANTLSYEYGSYKATLTALAWPINNTDYDRVTGYNSTPDNAIDTVGMFTIIVTPAPEPASMGLLAIGGAALLRRRRR